MWDSFLTGFCKVDAVCWHGDPNWLGWILIGILGIIVLTVSMIVLSVLSASWNSFDDWAGSVGGYGLFGKLIHGLLILFAVIAVGLAIGALTNFFATPVEK